MEPIYLQFNKQLYRIQGSLVQSDSRPDGSLSAVGSVISLNSGSSLDPGDLVSGSIAGNLEYTGGFIQSANYVSGSKGWKLDSFGNIKVNSLERRDFHLFTIFESLDGYSKTFVGAGTVTLGYQHWEAVTGTNSGDNCVVIKEFAAAFNAFTWNKDQKIKLGINPVSGNAGYGGILGIGLCDGSAGEHIGFYFSGNDASQYTLNTSVSNGASTTTLSLGIFNYGTYITLEAVYKSNTKVDYYVNGVLTITVTTTLPTGTTNANRIFQAYLTSSGGVQTLRVAYYDFWQSN